MSQQFCCYAIKGEQIKYWMQSKAIQEKSRIVISEAEQWFL